MIRFIISLTRLIFLAIILTVSSGCNSGRNGTTGSGKIVSEKRNITESFTGVNLKSGLEVVVIQSPETSVVVEADDNIQDQIITEVSNGILNITTEANGFFKSTKAKITVKMPIIKQLECSSGSRLQSGSKIVSDQLTVRSSGGSNLTLDAEADELMAESSSGSSLKLRGKAIKLQTSSSSGSTNDSGELHANEVESQASSGSSTYVRPILSLNAKASSGSSITYYGAPRDLNRTESSGGHVTGR